MTTEQDLYEWLGKDTSGVPYHLHLLNLGWSRDGVEHDLRVFQAVAARLRAEPQFWSAILRGAYGWRPTLVGCACLLLSHEQGFARALTDGFEQASVVQPQVAITVGLLYAVQARSFFGAFLSIPELCGTARAVVSAQRVLQRLGVLAESAVLLTDWPVGQQDDATLANAVVIQHWDFWSARRNA